MTIEDAKAGRELLKDIEEKERVLKDLQMADKVFDVTFTTGNRHLNFERTALSYETMSKIHEAVKQQYERELEDAKKQLESL